MDGGSRVGGGWVTPGHRCPDSGLGVGRLALDNAETEGRPSLSFQVSDPLQSHDAESEVGREGERLLLGFCGQAARPDARLLL